MNGDQADARQRLAAAFPSPAAVRQLAELHEAAAAVERIRWAVTTPEGAAFVRLMAYSARAAAAAAGADFPAAPVG